VTFSTSEHRDICRPFGVSMHAVVPSCTSCPPIQHWHGMVRPLPSCMRWNGDGGTSCPGAGALVIADRMTKPTTRAIRGRIFISRLLIDLVPWYAVPSPCASAQEDLRHTHMPPMTHRSSSRPTPCTPIGKCRSIRCHCSSLFMTRSGSFGQVKPAGCWTPRCSQLFWPAFAFALGKTVFAARQRPAECAEAH